MVLVCWFVCLFVCLWCVGTKPKSENRSGTQSKWGGRFREKSGGAGGGGRAKRVRLVHSVTQISFPSQTTQPQTRSAIMVLNLVWSGLHPHPGRPGRSRELSGLAGALGLQPEGDPAALVAPSSGRRRRVGGPGRSRAPGRARRAARPARPAPAGPSPRAAGRATGPQRGGTLSRTTLEPARPLGGGPPPTASLRLPPPPSGPREEREPAGAALLLPQVPCSVVRRRTTLDRGRGGRKWRPGR